MTVLTLWSCDLLFSPPSGFDYVMNSLDYRLRLV
jgi:hypothetical protein